VERAAGCGLGLLGQAVADADRVLVETSGAALDDPARLPELDAWVAVTGALPAERGRFAAGNVVLALRERLPGWESDPGEPAAAAALRRLAGRLQVSVPDRG
jgi:hypothetical protein